MSSMIMSIFGRSNVPIITQEHNLIHGGRLFSAQISSAALAAAGTLLMEMIVPAGIEVHVKPVAFYNSLAGRFELLEAPPKTDGNSAIPILNKKRNAVIASNVILWSNPSAISAGTVLDDLYFTTLFGSNVAVNAVDQEWILKPSTKYLFRLTNNGGVASTAFVKLNWYEVKL